MDLGSDLDLELDLDLALDMGLDLVLDLGLGKALELVFERRCARNPPENWSENRANFGKFRSQELTRNSSVLGRDV